MPQGGGGPGAGAEGMLLALVAEAGGEAPVVFSDELGGTEADPQAHAPHPRHVLDDDNAHTACLSESTCDELCCVGNCCRHMSRCRRRSFAAQFPQKSPKDIH